MIICCGDALIDMLPFNSEQDRQGFYPVPGGALFNTSISLGRLGETVGLISGVSTDPFGEDLLAELISSGVDASLCVRSGRLSTLAFVKMVDGNAAYLFFDENSAGRMLTIPDLPVIRDNVTTLHFGAISLMQEPAAVTYESLMSSNKHHKVISLDPNIRMDFIEDEDNYRARLSRMCAMSDIIKVSDDDLHWLAMGIDHDDIITNWLQDSASIVLITMGSKGAIAYTSSGTVQVPSQRTTVVDTVGAGDTFNAGFLAGLRRRGVLTKDKISGVTEVDLRSALDLACKVAAFTVSQAGANPPWQSDIE